DVLLVAGVEVTSSGLVAELEETVDAAVLAADARGEPTAHRRMLGLERPELTPQRMADDLLLREPYDLAGRDRHAVQADAVRINAEVAVTLVLRAQAEVLARLGRILADPQLQRSLLRAGHRPSDHAGAPEDRVEAFGERVVTARVADERRDLDADLSCVHPPRLDPAAPVPARRQT